MNNTPPSGPPPGPVGPPPRRTLRYRLRMLLRILSVIAMLMGLTSGGYAIYSIATHDESAPTSSSDSTTTTPSQDEDAKDVDADRSTNSADSATCTSSRLGVTVHIPGGWYANEQPAGHACEYFEESPFDTDSGAPDPEDVAIRLDRIDGSFDNISKGFHGAPPSGMAFDDVTDLTVNGHRAIRLRAGESTGTLRHYTYAVELDDDFVIVVAAHPIYGNGSEDTVDEIAQTIALTN